MSKSTIVVIVVMAIVVVSVAVIAMNLTDEAEDENAQWYGFIEIDDTDSRDDSWTPISTAEELLNMKPKGKYYLTDNIDLSNVNDPTSFEIEVITMVDRASKMVSVQLNYGGEQLDTLESSISVNHRINSGPQSGISYGTDPPAEIHLIAGGELRTPPAGKDAKYAISATIQVPETGPVSTILQSKGNFVPIAGPITLDGNGYVIIELRTTAVLDGAVTKAGLISGGDNILIKNLGLRGGSSVAVSSSGNTYSGRLIGYAGTNVSVTNSFSSGTSSSLTTYLTGHAYAGGFVASEKSTVTISSSQNQGRVTAMSSGFFDTYAGGLIGTNSSTVTIINSSNTGVMVSRTAQSSGSGGLVAAQSVNVTIEGSQNMGDMLSYTQFDTFLGGLVAAKFSNATVRNSLNTGNMIHSTPSHNCTVYMAGLIAAKTGSANIISSSNGGTITLHAGNNAYLAGLVTCTDRETSIFGSHNIGSITANVTGKIFSAGIIAYVEKNSYHPNINNSYNEGQISSSSSGSIEEAHSGGLVAYSGQIVKMHSTYNLGAVSSSSPKYATAGGLISYCYNKTTIDNSYNSGEVFSSSSRSSDAGGLIGVSDTVSITYSYNVGAVSATATDSTSYKGGLVGKVLSTDNINSCFILAGAVEDDKFVGNKASFAQVSEIRSEAELKDQATYYGWDFKSIWMIDKESKFNNGYPQHRHV